MTTHCSIDRLSQFYVVLMSMLTACVNRTAHCDPVKSFMQQPIKQHDLVYEMLEVLSLMVLASTRGIFSW